MIKRANNKFSDGSRFGEVLRALSTVFTSVDDWRPIVAAAQVSGHLWWVKGTEKHDFLCPQIFDKNHIIQLFIDYYNFKSYLEIGGQPSDPNSTFNTIRCASKHAIDPEEKENATFCMTSDEFFEKHGGEQKYGAVFIDGWHEHKQVYRDIVNSLENLEDDGVIILHDMIPLTRDLEKDPLRTGCCWRAFAELRKRDDLNMAILVPPWGSEDSLGIIRKGKQVPFEGEIEFNYDFLINNIEDLMNTMDINSLFTEFFPLIDFSIAPNPNFHNDGHKETITMSMKKEWYEKYAPEMIVKDDDHTSNPALITSKKAHRANPGE